MSPTTWIIIGAVGIVVLLIIIAQAIALCYFRRKAIPVRRMDSLTARSRFDRGDRARYSAPPCRKNSKSNTRAQADTDSHIYEMVGVNALYNGSHELNSEAKNDTTENTIKERPPLPLPHEIPETVPMETLPRTKPSPLASMPSSLSLNSISSGTLTSMRKGKEPPGQGFKKAPARPPKHVDEDSIPDSLKRPPKTTPAGKARTMPKMTPTDPTLLELKNAFQKRNVGNDLPSPSLTTLLTKEPPKVQAKPNKKQKNQEQESQNTKPLKPIGGVNPFAPPGGQTNQIKLILPRIVPKATQEPTLSPIRPNPTPPMKPMSQTPVSQVPQNRPLPPPITSVSHMTPVSLMTVMSHMNPMSQTPPQNRPLPTSTAPVPHLTQVPHASPFLQNRGLPFTPAAPLSSRPLPPDPLPPIYHTAEEDLTRNTDDEEEWTYEQLDKYNIYNI